MNSHGDRKEAYKNPNLDPSPFLTETGSGRTIRQFVSQTVILTRGEPADAVYHIQKGSVKLSGLTEGGKETILGLLGVGDFMAEGCIAGHKRHMLTATAFTDCSILKVEKMTMLKMLRGEPAFATLFITYLIKRNHQIYEDLLAQRLYSAEQRLARTLLLLASFEKSHAKEPILQKISQEALAEMVGTTRSRVSFFMNRFRIQGHISYGARRRDGFEIRSSLREITFQD